MWFFYAIAAGTLNTISGLAGRYILRSDNDSWIFSFYYSFFGALVSLPFMILNFKSAHTLPMWAFVVFVGALVVFHNFLFFKSSTTLEVSIGGAIIKFRLIWAFLLSVFLLHEGFSLGKVVGTLLTVVAGLVIIHKFRAPKSLQGVIFAFASTILYATIIIFYKFLFAQFNSVTLTFFIFLIPACINFFLIPHAFKRAIRFFQKNVFAVLLSCMLGAFSNLALNTALSLGEVSKVLVINEAFLVLVLVGEHLFLKERENAWIKITAVSLAVLGAVFILL